tara:strand:- start:459 stop:644 length:186 start_codon:yes stop_codon:yes gene_type:complete
MSPVEYAVKDLPTFKVKQTVKIEHTWIVQAENIDVAKDQALITDPDDSNELDTLAYSVEAT